MMKVVVADLQQIIIERKGVMNRAVSLGDAWVTGEVTEREALGT